MSRRVQKTSKESHKEDCEFSHHKELQLIQTVTKIRTVISFADWLILWGPIAKHGNATKLKV